MYTPGVVQYIIWCVLRNPGRVQEWSKCLQLHFWGSGLCVQPRMLRGISISLIGSYLTLPSVHRAGEYNAKMIPQTQYYTPCLHVSSDTQLLRNIKHCERPSSELVRDQAALPTNQISFSTRTHPQHLIHCGINELIIISSKNNSTATFRALHTCHAPGFITLFSGNEFIVGQTEKSE